MRSGNRLYFFDDGEENSIVDTLDEAVTGARRVFRELASTPGAEWPREVESVRWGVIETLGETRHVVVARAEDQTPAGARLRERGLAEAFDWVLEPVAAQPIADRTRATSRVMAMVSGGHALEPPLYLEDAVQAQLDAQAMGRAAGPDTGWMRQSGASEGFVRVAHGHQMQVDCLEVGSGQDPHWIFNSPGERHVRRLLQQAILDADCWLADQMEGT